MKAKLVRATTTIPSPPKGDSYSAMHVVALHKGELKVAATAEFYGESRVTCRLRAFPPSYTALYKRFPGAYTPSGKGVADGGGYHKESAALDTAVANAGFKLDHTIDGRGDDSMDEAMFAVARATGYRGKLLVVRP